MAVHSSADRYHQFAPIQAIPQATTQAPPPASAQAAPEIGPASPRSTLLQDAAGPAPAAPEEDSEDSGRSDSDSTSSSERESSSSSDSESANEANAADLPGVPAERSDAEAASDRAGSADNGNAPGASDRLRPPGYAAPITRRASADAEPAPAPASLQAPSPAPSLAKLPSPPADADPHASLYTGVTTIRGDEIEVGGYLASGAFGKVYRGTWGRDRVALKQIDFAHAQERLPLSEDEIAEALQWEISRLATTSHPNLVQFHGVCRKDGKTYLVMEFCDGGSLAGVLEKGPIPHARLWQWMREIAEALAYLHGQGMLHRDLKAENVLIDSRGRAKLADLGVAQVDALLQESEAKAVSMGLQDVSFIAPENIANVRAGSLRQSSKATDIYALGLVFWQMLAGGGMPSLWEELLRDPAAVTAMKAGQRMPIPADCPQPMRKLLVSCWQLKAAERADIAKVLRQLRRMGQQLHPQAATLDLLEHLELSLHAKRPQMRDHVPAQVAAQAVQGRLEDYWSPWEAAGVSGTSTAAATTTTTATAATTTSSAPLGATAAAIGNPPSPLQQVFDDFLAQPQAGALLLLGEAGLGKTLGMHLLAERLQQQWWRHLADPDGCPRPPYLPILLRDHVKEWSEAALNGACASLASRFGLPADGPRLLLFIDAYDECRPDTDAPGNLASRLGLPDTAKLIISCRPDALKEEERFARFAFHARLQTWHCLPFRIDQLLGYLQNRLGWDDRALAQYRARLLQSTELRAVLRNPFVLYLLSQSWETLNAVPLERLTRAHVYAGFLRRQVEAHAALLAPSVRATLRGATADLAASHAAFAGRIALLAARSHRMALPEDEAEQARSPWSRLRQLVEEEAKQRYGERIAQIEQLDEGERREHQRRMVLTQGDFVNMRLQAAAQLASVLPLRLRGGNYEYSHKSVFEYCAAQQLLAGLEETNIEIDYSALLGWIEGSAPHVLLFVHEIWQRDDATRRPPSDKAGADPVRVRRLVCLLDAVGKALAEHREAAAEALDHAQQALALQEAFGADAPALTATCCNNLGLALQKTGRYEEALPHMRRALDLREQALGAMHEFTVASRNDLAVLMLDLGRLKEALALQRSAVAIAEASFGDKHLTTAVCCSNLSMTLMEMDLHEEALACCERAHAIYLATLDSPHRYIATSHDTLGGAFQRMGRHKEAVGHFRAALAMNECLFEPEHSIIAISCSNLANALRCLGQSEQALALHQKAVAIS